MKYSGFVANVLKLRPDLRRVLLPAFTIILITSTAAMAWSSSPNGTDEIKKLIKEATKLSRAGLLVQAEAVLQRAIDLDTKRSEAKVELAYVYVKEHRLLEAYNTSFPIAQAEPRNGRAFAVLGMTLVTGGRFREARLILFKALQIDRNEDLAWAGYGMLDFYENKIDDSLNNLREAVYHEPNEPDYLFTLAQVAARSENFQEAATAYDQFLRISNSADAERRDRIKGLINFLRFLGHTGRLYVSDGEDRAKIPFELVGNRPIISLRINGKSEPLRFVLDTGSGISVISETTAKRLKISPVTKGGFARGIGGNGKFEIVYGMLRQIDIGAVRIRNTPVYIRKFQSDGQMVDGYIGLALISKFLTTIDYGDQTFSLTKKDEDKREFRENNDVSLPLRLTSSGFLSGEVQLQGVESTLNFIVDTGASVSVISDRVSKTEGISPFASVEKLRIIGSAGITDDVSTFMLPLVSFGSHSRKSIMAVALDLDIINEASGFEQAGILGGNFLKNYRLTFDFKNSKVTFVSIKPEKE